MAIATRHADAVDIKFLVDGHPVWVALPHPAWVEYQYRTGKVITDPLAVEIAGHYLKTALESGEGLGREMYSLTVAETLWHIDELRLEIESQAIAANGSAPGGTNNPVVARGSRSKTRLIADGLKPESARNGANRATRNAER